MHLLQQLAASSTSSAGEVAELLQLHRQAMDAEQDDRLQLMAQVMCHCPFSCRVPDLNQATLTAVLNSLSASTVLYWDQQS
jgi:hypothetical protein